MCKTSLKPFTYLALLLVRGLCAYMLHVGDGLAFNVFLPSTVDF